MRRAALALLALAVGGSALAQDVQSPIRSRVPEAIKTWTQEEILREFGPITRTGGGFGGRVIRQLPKAGRYIKWGGGLIIGGILVNDALSWFYNEAKRSTGTALDDWYRPGVSGQAGVVFTVTARNICGFGEYFGGTVTEKRICASSVEEARNFVDATLAAANVSAAPWSAPAGRTDMIERLLLSDSGPLGDHLRNHPDAVNALKDAVAEYLNTHPDLIPSLLDPIPNANQLADDIVDPGLDTDGDGMTDGDELRRGPGVTTTPGNRPHPDDGPITDPSDPASKPVDTDGDGIPDWRDSDDDNDGVPDDEETPEGQKDKTKKPEKFMDTDGDGIPDDQDQDDDGDGWSDQAEETAGSDSKDKNDTPENKPCAAGEARAKDGMCKPEEDSSDDDSGNECGDFSVDRLIAYTGEYLRDVVFPCEDVGDILKPITDTLKSKFPFSLAASLNGWFHPPSGGASPSQLPDKLGIIPLDWGWLTPLWTIIKNVVGVALWAWFVYWLIDRFTPRTQI